MPKERKLPLYGLLPLLTMPATGVRQVRTITFCFLYSTIIPNPPLPVKGKIAFLSPYFFRAPESAFFSSAAPCKGQAYEPQAAPAAPGQTGSARFGGAGRRRACGPPWQTGGTRRPAGCAGSSPFLRQTRRFYGPAAPPPPPPPPGPGPRPLPAAPRPPTGQPPFRRSNPPPGLRPSPRLCKAARPRFLPKTGPHCVVIPYPGCRRCRAAGYPPGTPAKRRRRWRCGSSYRRSPAAVPQPRCHRRR